jgi:protein-S-isoprenylcysteine O-methyltransferase Ste14
MNKLNAMGIGPKVGGIVLPWLALAVFFSVRYKNAFAYIDNDSRILFILGIALVSAGALLYFFTVPALLKGLKETRLVTKGAFYLCCNPLYSSILLFIIPGVSFMMNSWLVLTASIVGFTFFKMYIRSEYVEMEKFFGNEYRKYRAETPEFLPFPVRKWFKAI